MEFVNKHTFEELITNILGKIVRFKSDCEFFPNFDVTGKILSYRIINSELVFKLKTHTNKIIDVGSNMKNLRYEVTNNIYKQNAHC